MKDWPREGGALSDARAGLLLLMRAGISLLMRLASEEMLPARTVWPLHLIKQYHQQTWALSLAFLLVVVGRKQNHPHHGSPLLLPNNRYNLF